MEKLSSVKTVPDAKKVGDCCWNTPLALLTGYVPKCRSLSQKLSETYYCAQNRVHVLMLFSGTEFLFLKVRLGNAKPWTVSFPSEKNAALIVSLGFPGGSDGKSICLQCRRPGFDPWVGKIPWRRIWHPTPVLLPGKSHGRRSLVGHSPWCHQE